MNTKVSHEFSHRMSFKRHGFKIFLSSTKFLLTFKNSPFWLLSKRWALSAGKDEEKRQPSCTAGEKVNWCSRDGKHYDDSLRIKRWTTIQSSNPTSRYRSKGIDISISKTYCTPPPIFTAILLTVTKIWKQKLNVHQWTNEWCVYIYTHWNIIMHEKKEILPFVIM